MGWKSWAPPLAAALAFYGVSAAGSRCATDVVYRTALGSLAEKFPFVLYGDTREGMEPWRAYRDLDRRRIMARIVESRPAFIVNSGDLVGSGGEGRSWARFDDLTRAARELGIPYLPALGNHEYHDFGRSAVGHYFSRFPGIGKWYAFRAAWIQFVVLDSNDSRLSDQEKRDELEFLSDSLRKASADPGVRLAILVYHHPAFTNSIIHAPSEWVRANIVERASKFDKPLVHLAGHVHGYERFSSPTTYVVSGGGGAPLTALQTDPAKQRLAPAFRGSAITWHHFILARAEPFSVEFEVQALEGADWKVVDRFRAP